MNNILIKSKIKKKIFICINFVILYDLHITERESGGKELLWSKLLSMVYGVCTTRMFFLIGEWGL